jgi:hypothetical protein
MHISYIAICFQAQEVSKSHPHSESLPSANAKPCIPGSVLFKAFLFFSFVGFLTWLWGREQQFGAPGRTKFACCFSIFLKTPVSFDHHI